MLSVSHHEIFCNTFEMNIYSSFGEICWDTLEKSMLYANLDERYVMIHWEYL